MQILWLTENYPPKKGGVALDCARITQGLRDKGIRVDVVYFTSGEQLQAKEGTMGYQIGVPLSERPEHTLTCLYNFLTDPVNELYYSHIVAFGGSLPLIALPIYKDWMGCKSVTMLRSNDFDMNLFSPLKRASLFDAINASDMVCTLSKEAQYRVKRLFPRSRVEKINPGINSADWFCEASDYSAAEAFKEKYRLHGKITIGMFGRIREKKGAAFFLENVLKTGLNKSFNFVIAGDIDEKVKRWIDSVSDLLNIIHLPFADHSRMLQIYPACDFVAIPSHYEGFPNVLLEAGVLGIPVIASRTGGAAELFANSENSLTFYPGNAAECQTIIRKAATLTAEHRAKVAEQTRKKILSDFTAKAEIEKYFKLLSGL